MDRKADLNNMRVAGLSVVYNDVGDNTVGHIDALENCNIFDDSSHRDERNRIHKKACLNNLAS